MKLFVIVGQRKCRYKGQYSPEVLDAGDEFTNDGDPRAWLEARLQMYRNRGEFQSLATLAVHVPDAAVSAALNPKPVECTAVVEDSHDEALKP